MQENDLPSSQKVQECVYSLHSLCVILVGIIHDNFSMAIGTDCRISQQTGRNSGVYLDCQQRAWVVA
jgi:hypothetical protein